MTGIPAKASFTGGSVTQGQFKTTLDQLIDALDERLVNGATPIQADTINEASVGAGVTLDGLLVKDGEVHLDLGGAKTIKLLNMSAADYGKLLQVSPDGAALEVIGSSHGFRNRIINGGFLVWQRGTLFTVTGYTADRWRLSTTTGGQQLDRQAFTVGQSDVPGEPEFFARVTPNSAAISLNQRIEDVRTFAGQTITLSFYANASTGTPDITIAMDQHFGAGGSSSVLITSINKTLSAVWQKYSVTTTVPSISGKTVGASSYVRLQFFLNLSANIDIANVQLEQGGAATPFEERPIATELALCQRYYAELDKASSAWAISSTTVAFSHEWPVEMRVAPTMAIIDTTFSFNDYNTGPVSVSPALSTWSFTTKGGQSQATGFTGLFQSRPGFINQTNPVWSVDAEL